MYPPDIFGFYGGCSIFRFLGLPSASAGCRRGLVRESGKATQSSSTVIPGNIRILGGFRYFSSRGLPVRPCKGSAYVNPKFKYCICREYSDSGGLGGVFSCRELPRAAGAPLSGRRVRQPEVQTMYSPWIFGFYGGYDIF